MDVPEQQPHILNLNHTSRNTTLNATHSTIDFHPVCTATNCEEWRYATYRRNGSLPMTFRHTNNYHRQHTLEIGWKLSFRGAFLILWDCAISQLNHHPQVPIFSSMVHLLAFFQKHLARQNSVSTKIAPRLTSTILTLMRREAVRFFLSCETTLIPLLSPMPDSHLWLDQRLEMIILLFMVLPYKRSLSPRWMCL